MIKKRFFLLTVSYDGTNYCGFQLQENGITVQEILEKYLSKTFKEKIRLRGASRTDARVHALGQRVHFSTTDFGVPQDKLKMILNHILPSDISICAVEEVSEQFHSIYDATSKTYQYQILNQPDPNPFLAPYFWYISRKLDLSAMRAGADYFLGEHDFSSFRSAGYQTKTSVRKINECGWEKNENQLIFTINGNGFLYHMVRNIVGTLVEIGCGKYPPEKVLEMISACDRSAAGPTAPPQGLFLKEVFY